MRMKPERLAPGSHLGPDWGNEPEADFILVEGVPSCWVAVDGFALKISRYSGGVVVEISSIVNGETQDEILASASAYPGKVDDNENDEHFDAPMLEYPAERYTNYNHLPVWMQVWARVGDDMRCPECNEEGVETQDYVTTCHSCGWTGDNVVAVMNAAESSKEATDE